MSFGAKLEVEIISQIRGRHSPAVRWSLDKSMSTEEGKLMVMKRLSPPAQGETYKSVSDQLQLGLRHLCGLYDIGMPYRNGVQFDKTRTYFGFHTEAIFFFTPF